jgi:4,5-DOPA dioxygenase extradiol
MSLPAIFVSHGAPLLALEPGETGVALARLGRELARPTAILCVSAHWETVIPTVTRSLMPPTIHDFGGFPPAMYDLQYPAPGAPALAERTATLLEAAGIKCEVSKERGLDHGAWVPLMLMYPSADIPVTQLSIQSHLDPSRHLAMGRALASLRNEGVLILASGSAVHNLGAVSLGGSGDAAVPAWASEFEGWLHEHLITGDVAALMDFAARAPHAAKAHPRAEHLIPLFVALGAAGPELQVGVLHRGWTYGSLSMAAYGFEGRPNGAKEA